MNVKVWFTNSEWVSWSRCRSAYGGLRNVHIKLHNGTRVKFQLRKIAGWAVSS